MLVFKAVGLSFPCDQPWRMLLFAHTDGGVLCAVTNFAGALQALASLNCLDDSEAKQSMEGMVSYVLDRLY